MSTNRGDSQGSALRSPMALAYCSASTPAPPLSALDDASMEEAVAAEQDVEAAMRVGAIEASAAADRAIDEEETASDGEGLQCQILGHFTSSFH